MATEKRTVYKRLIINALVIGIMYFSLRYFAVDRANTPEHFTTLSPAMVDYIKNTKASPLVVPNFDKNKQIIVHPYHVIQYNEYTEQADWIAYLLTESMTHGRSTPPSRFRRDPSVKTKTVTPKEYLNSGFTLGQLIPPPHMQFDQKAFNNTYLMSNVCPMDPGFEKYLWKTLGKWENKWVKQEDSLLIITGPVFVDTTYFIGKNTDVGIPQGFFKVFMDYSAPNYKAIAFVMANSTMSTQVRNHAVSIDSVEKLTGHDFFHLLPDSIEENLESNVHPDIWFYDPL